MALYLSKKEWKFLCLVGVGVMVITTAPFVYGFLHTPPDKYFLGFHTLASGDYSVYLSYILQTYDGHFLFRDLFTGESSSYNMLNTFWVVVGFLGKALRVSPIVAFHVSRIISLLLLLVSIYIFVGLYEKDIAKRKILFLFLTFSTGISGYFLSYFDKIYYAQDGYFHRPMDLWVPESNIFLSMLHSGHMSLALALTISIFSFTWFFIKTEQYRWSILAGIFLLSLVSFYPFQLPMVLGVLGSFWFVSCVAQKKFLQKLLYHLIIMVTIISPLLWYYFFMLRIDAVMAQRNAQNLNFTPAWYFFLTSFGVLVPLAMYRIWRILRERSYNENVLFLFVWLIFQLILIYLPFHFQRRTIGGLQLPLTIFAVEGLLVLFHRIKARAQPFVVQYILSNKMVLVYLFIFVFGFSNAVVVAKNIVLYYTQSPYVYHPLNDILAMQWLKENLSENDTVLSHYSSGYLIPGYSGKRVFLGHGVETIYFEKKKQDTQAFFSGSFGKEAQTEFLQKNNITYVYFGDFEKSYGTFNPDEKNYLKKAYQNNAVSIYKVL